MHIDPHSKDDGVETQPLAAKKVGASTPYSIYLTGTITLRAKRVGLPKLTF